MCVNCGWRHRVLPVDVLTVVWASIGKTEVAEGKAYSRRGTGKPPISGWERRKRGRDREQAQFNRA